MHVRPIPLRSPARAQAWGLPWEPWAAPSPTGWWLAEAPGIPLSAPLAAQVTSLAQARNLEILDADAGLLLRGLQREIGRLASDLTRDPLAQALGTLLRARLDALHGPPPEVLETHRGPIDLSRPRVMGILNVTPDSFFPGSRAQGVEAAVKRALEMVAAGADILDIGGESTRPGAAVVSADEERARVVPVIAALAERTQVPLSVDTSKAIVAREAVDAGAALINDVWSFQADPGMAEVAARSGAGVVLMHGRGDPRSMGRLAHYRAVVGEVLEELDGLYRQAVDAGVDAERIVLDPGIGFAKVGAMNVALLGEVESFLCLGRPLLIGASRKSFLGQVFDHPLDERLPGSLAAVARSIQGGARILRVHDVRETRQLVDVLQGFEDAPPG